jgi:hypothetical protein
MSRKSALISYFSATTLIPFGLSYVNAFRELGYDVCRFNSQVESRWRRSY